MHLVAAEADKMVYFLGTCDLPLFLSQTTASVNRRGRFPPLLGFDLGKPEVLIKDFQSGLSAMPSSLAPSLYHY